MAAYMAALIASQRMDKYFEHQGASSSSRTTEENDDGKKSEDGEGDAKSDLPSSTIPKPPPHLVRSSTETTYQPMDVEGGLTSDAFERFERTRGSG